MSEADHSAKTVKIEGRHRTMTILWIVFLTTVLLYTVIAFILRPPATTSTAGENQTLLMALFALGLSSVVASFAVKKIYMSRAAREQRPDMVQTGFILALVFCEMAALWGFIALFVTMHTYSYLLFPVAALGLLLHFPRREHLLAASYRG